MLTIIGCSGAEQASPERLERFAALLRAEGALFGSGALAERFEGLDPARDLADPGILPYFLAASIPEVLCADSRAPLIAWISPIHRRAWLTRWNLPELGFAGSGVVELADPSDDWSRHWIARLLDSGEAVDVEPLFRAALDQRRATLREREAELCAARLVETSGAEPPRLTDGDERGLDPAHLWNEPGLPKTLNDAVLRLFNERDPRAFNALLPVDRNGMLDVLADRPAGDAMVPAFTRRGGDLLILYADLAVPGSYLVVITPDRERLPAAAQRLQQIDIEMFRL